MATQTASDTVQVVVTAAGAGTQTATDTVAVVVSSPATGGGTQVASDVVQVVVTAPNTKFDRWTSTGLQPATGRWGAWNGTGIDWLT